MNFRAMFSDGNWALNPVASSADALYPVEKLYDTRPGKIFKFTGNTDENIVYDLGVAKTPTVFVIANHNITQGGTITIEMHSADAWVGAQTNIDTLTGAEITGTHVWVFGGQNFRYARIRIQDSGNSANVSIGQILIGEYFEFTSRNYNKGKIYNILDNTKLFISDGGCIWEENWSEIDGEKLNFSGILDSEITSFLSDSNRGHSKGFFWLEETKGLYGIMKKLVIKEVCFNNNSFSVNVIEDSNGIII